MQCHGEGEGEERARKERVENGMNIGLMGVQGMSDIIIMMLKKRSKNDDDDDDHDDHDHDDDVVARINT
jgi:hypothetical protein